ncbi:MAG: HYR domain-containing protein, partial [Chloroflexota bacterium]|nr:HYR domain-containing protein [Chloroflexota bacterium]
PSGEPRELPSSPTPRSAVPVPATCAPTSGSVFPLGETTVNCSAGDAAGNPAQGSFKVTVVDTTAPALNLPANMTAPATGPDGATVSFTATATDLVDGSVPVTCVPASGSVFPAGETTVNCTAVDGAGNPAQGSFKVTVTDAAAPVLNLPDDIAVETDNPDGVEVEFTATATDAVDGAVPVTCVPASGSVFPVGETTVNCTAVDAAGNPAQGSFKVTVTDAAAPVLNLPDDIAVETDNPDGVAVEFTATATDAVDGTVPVTCAPASGSVFPVGETTVNCSAVNSAGKQTQGSFKVTVELTTDPTGEDPNGVYLPLLISLD